jgi:hypothetical protein
MNPNARAENSFTASTALAAGNRVSDAFRGLKDKMNETPTPNQTISGKVRKAIDAGIGLPKQAVQTAYNVTGSVANAAGRRLTSADKFLTDRAPGARTYSEGGLQRIGNAAAQGTDLAARGLQGTLAGAEYAAAKAAEAREQLARSTSRLAQKVWDNRPKTLSDYILKNANALANIPTFYKLAFLICFYFFFYKIFYDIGIFFGLSSVELILYMAWFGMLLFFVSFIKPNRSRLY